MSLHIERGIAGLAYCRECLRFRFQPAHLRGCVRQRRARDARANAIAMAYVYGGSEAAEWAEKQLDACPVPPGSGGER